MANDLEQLARKISTDLDRSDLKDVLTKLLGAILEEDRTRTKDLLFQIGTFMLEPEPLDKPIVDTQRGKHAPSGSVSQIVISCPKCSSQLTISHP